MTRAELGQRMSSKEFVMWKLYYEHKAKLQEEYKKEIDRDAELERKAREAEDMTRRMR